MSVSNQLMKGLQMQLAREKYEKKLRELFITAEIFEGNQNPTPKKVYEIFKKWESRIFNSDQLNLKVDQSKVIFPNHRMTKLIDFDASLLVGFILEFINVNNEDKADLYKIRRTRNAIQHSGVEFGAKNTEMIFHDVFKSLGGKEADRQEVDSLNLDAVTLKRLRGEIDKALIESCRANSERGVAHDEEDEADDLENRLGGVTYKLLPHIRTFVGRDVEVAEIHKVIRGLANKKTALIVTGLTGVGKSEVARRYCNDFRESFYDENVIWINGVDTTEIKRSFQDAVTFNKLAHIKDNFTPELAVKLFYKYFDKRKLLIVFDNVNEANSLDEFMPPPNMSVKPYIIITTYISHWKDFGMYTVGPLMKVDGREFLHNHLPLKFKSLNDDLKDKVCRVVGAYPLTLQHIISYATSNQVTFEDVTEMYKRRAEYVMPKSFTNNFGNGSALLPYYTPVDRLINEKNNSLPLKLLSYIAHLDPYHVKKSFVYHISKISLEEVKKALDVINNFCLTYEPLRYEEGVKFEDEYIQLHIPVGVMLRHNQMFREKTSEGIFDELFSVMLDHAHKQGNIEQDWLRQFLYLYSHTFYQKRFYQKIQDEETQSLLFKIFSSFDKYEELDDVMEKLIAYHHKTNQNDMRSPVLLHAFKTRANCMRKLGRAEKAEEYLEIIECHM